MSLAMAGLNRTNGRGAIGVGVYDGLTARLAARHGFDFLWISSFCVSASAGLPDMELLGPADLAAVTAQIRAVAELPILVDLGSGYGEPLQVEHAVSRLAAAGAHGVCLEDNPSQGKRSSLYEGIDRTLVDPREHCCRLRAARSALDRAGGGFLVARTEALVAGLGIEEALARSETYLAAGAQAVFIQSIDRSGGEILRICELWRGRAPLVLAPTRYPKLSNEILFQAGATHLIFANQVLRAAHRAVDSLLSDLRRHGGLEQSGAKLSTVETISSEVGVETLLERSRRFEEPVGSPILSGDAP